MKLQERAKVWLYNAFGTAVIGVMLAAVLAINLYAVHTLMDTEISTYIQYAVATVCVFVEGFGLVLMKKAWNDGRWGAAGIFIVATFIALCNSAANEAAFYNLNFADKAQRRTATVDIAHDTAKEKAEIEARLDKAAGIRPVGVIENEVTAALAARVRGDRYGRTLGQLTKDCTSTRSDYYSRCGDVLSLRAELANAVALTPEIDKDRARLATIRASKDWTTTIGVTHPGASLIANVINWVKDWRGGSAKDHVSDDLIQAILVGLLVLATQFFHLSLPFAFFGKRAKSKAAEQPVSKIADLNLTAAPGAPGVEVRLGADRPPAPATIPLEAVAANSNVACIEAPGGSEPDEEPAPEAASEASEADKARRLAFADWLPRYTELIPGAVMSTMHLHAAHIASVTDEEMQFGPSVISRELRQVPGYEHIQEGKRAGNHRTLDGICLNKEGRRLAGLSTRDIHMAANAAKGRLAKVA